MRKQQQFCTQHCRSGGAFYLHEGYWQYFQYSCQCCSFPDPVLVNTWDFSITFQINLYYHALYNMKISFSSLLRDKPPKTIERFSLLKSVHIFKKHRVQYEVRTHYMCLEVRRKQNCSRCTIQKYCYMLIHKWKCFGEENAGEYWKQLT